MTAARHALNACALALALARASETHAAPPAPPPQTRSYESDDVNRLQRLSIAALQDLGFALESADAESGVITASRLDTHPLRLTVTITAANESTINAAISADYSGAPISDPRPAEAFFSALARQLTPPPAID